jgi:hypothetical protein
MKAIITVTLFSVSLLLTTAAIGKDGKDDCATRDLAGRWIFATDVGQQQLFLPSTEGGITSLGTMNIDKQGNLSGEFDFVVGGFITATGNTYTGTVSLATNCTGTLTFRDSTGNSRTDRIALVSKDEVWAMSLDPSWLWTYKMRKISRKSVKDH